MLKDKGTGYLHPQHTLHFPEYLVRQVSSFRYFGITLDNKLSFDSHNTTATNTASKDSPPSTNSKHSLLPPPHLLLLLYKNIIQSIIPYCSPVFSPSCLPPTRTSCPKLHTLLPKLLVVQPPTSQISVDTPSTNFSFYAHLVTNTEPCMF